MQRHVERPRAILLKACLVGLAVPGAFLAAWQILVEQATCESTAMFGCAGPGLFLMLVGVPLTYVVWSLGLTWAGLALPWLAPVMVMACLVVVVPLTAGLHVPTAAWIAVIAVMTTAWAKGTRSWGQH